MKVGPLMTQVVHSCHPEDSLQSKIVGIMMDPDSCIAAYTQSRSLRDIPVSREREQIERENSKKSSGQRPTPVA
jgi:hypothetical protein